MSSFLIESRRARIEAFAGAAGHAFPAHDHALIHTKMTSARRTVATVSDDYGGLAAIQPSQRSNTAFF